MNRQLLQDLVQSIENRKQTEQRLRATVRHLVEMSILLTRSENQILVLETLLKRLVQVCVHTQDKRLAKELKLMDFTRLAKRISDDHTQMRQMLLHEETGMLNQQSPAENYLLEAVTGSAAAPNPAVGGGEPTPTLDDPQLSGGAASQGNAVNLSNFRASSAGPSSTSHPHPSQVQMHQQLMQQQAQHSQISPQQQAQQAAQQAAAAAAAVQQQQQQQQAAQHGVGPRGPHHGQHSHSVSPQQQQQQQQQAAQAAQQEAMRRSSSASLQAPPPGGPRTDSAMQLRNLWSQDGGHALEGGSLPGMAGPGAPDSRQDGNGLRRMTQMPRSGSALGGGGVGAMPSPNGGGPGMRGYGDAEGFFPS